MSLTQESQSTVSLPQSPATTNLRIPGPIPVPPEIAAAGAWPMMNHRGPEFGAIMTRTFARLHHFFQTNNDILVFPGSGSAGWEATIANCFSAGDRVAIIIIGNFGERFALTATAFGLDVQRIEFLWGEAADPAIVAERLRAMPDLRGVFFTHNETSTGITNDLAALTHTIRAAVPEALIVVDTVSSLGCVNVPADELGLDVIFTGSQKGWMCPPGLMMIAVGPRAIEAGKHAKLPRFFWDFARARAAYAKNAPPYTVPVTLWYQLDVALAMMENEGREAIFARHAALGAFTRQRVQELGLHLFATSHFSDTVTAIKAPAGQDVKALLKALREEDGVVFGGGQGQVEGKIFRIGHLGSAHEQDIAEAMAALARRLH